MNAGVNMDWIMKEDDPNQQFMREKPRDVLGNLKKRVDDLQKMERKKLY